MSRNAAHGRGTSGNNQFLPRIHYPKRPLARALTMSHGSVDFSRIVVIISRTSNALSSRCN